MTPEDIIRSHPLVAILRGVRPDEVLAIGHALYDSGIRCVEVPLNSPDPLASIEALAGTLPDDCLVGAGTVLDDWQVDAVRNAGGRLIVSPAVSSAVIARAVDSGALVMPGFATATEACTAIRAGARFLKLFPASTYGPRHARALSAVLPDSCSLFAVGGIAPTAFAEWLDAGVLGFGAGSELYRKGDSAAKVGERALDFVAHYREAAAERGPGTHRDL